MPDMIKKNAGEQHSPSIAGEVRAVLASRHAITALRTGSVVLVRRGGGWLTAEGWRGFVERSVGVGFGVYVAVYGSMAQPQALAVTAPAAAGAWLLAAWTLAPRADWPPTPEPEGEEQGPAAAFTRWLLDLMADRPGVHLYELYPAMRTLPGHEHHDDAALRLALRALGIPVERSMRVGAVAGRSGVYRAALPPLPSPHGEPCGERDGDAGQSADSPVGERPESAMEST